MIALGMSRRLPWASLGGVSGALLPVAILLLVLLMVVPVPPLLRDIGFILNIAVSLAVLMVALSVARPLDFSSFPAVLLFATLFRLALNVASTRVVLVHGHNGPGAAGEVIEAFGDFLIAGDIVVGIFVFAILLIINLVVITKGAGRVSEVSARFVLDALPGKQMAIDADLNAGLLTPEDATKRRQDVATEADFYGSMDGASKFVKGDAIAGVLILAVNMLGGIMIGVLQHDLPVGEAASTYLHLSIGDALVAQVPALLLSIAAAGVVTRVSSQLDLADQITSQFASAKAWGAAAGILGLLGLLPGMPNMLLLCGAAGCGWLARSSHRMQQPGQATSDAAADLPLSQTVVTWNEVADDSVISIDLGLGLLGLVDEARGGNLMARITGVRRQMSRDLGFVVPMVRVSDDLAAPPDEYRISVCGVVVGTGKVEPDGLMAILSGTVSGSVVGRPAVDPTYGLPCLWIDPHQRADAVVAGYTVVDPPTVIATQLSSILAIRAPAILGIEDVQALLDRLAQTAPQLAGALSSQSIPLPMLASICRMLLSEGISLREFRRIADAIVQAMRSANDPQLIAELVREQIGELIVQSIVPHDLPLPVMTLHPTLEDMLVKAVRIAPGNDRPFEPGLAEQIVASLARTISDLDPNAITPALVTGPQTRRPLARLVESRLPTLRVLSFREIPDSKVIDMVAVVGGSESDPEGAPQ